MKVPSAYQRNRGPLEIAMTPMIDVVFLLLVFFVWTASFQTVELLLPSQVEDVGGSAAVESLPPELQDLERIVVRIIRTGDQTTWIMNQQPIAAWPEIKQRLATVAAIRTNLPVTIDPDLEVSVGETIRVYDAARSVGFDQIQFTAPETELPNR